MSSPTSANAVPLKAKLLQVRSAGGKEACTEGVDLFEGVEQGLFLGEAGTGSGVLHALEDGFLGSAGFGSQQSGIAFFESGLQGGAPAWDGSVEIVWHRETPAYTN